MKFKKRFLAFICTVFAILIMSYAIYFLGSGKISMPSRYDLVQLEQGWTINRDADIIHTDALSQTSIGIVNKGNTVTLSTTLPETGVTPATLEYRTVLSTTEVYLAGKLIYSFGEEYVEQDKMPPKYFHFIALPDDYFGKDLDIVITAREDSAFSGLSAVLLGNYNDITKSILQHNRIALTIGIFQTIFGFILIVLSPYMFFSKRRDFSIFFEGIVALTMGLYILCFNDLLWYVSDSPDFCTFLEYFSLFTIPAAIVGFITSARQIYDRSAGYILMSINMSFVVLTTLFHAINVMHICHFVQWLHMIGVVECIFFIVSLLVVFINNAINQQGRKIKNSSTYMLIIGLILFLACAIIDIIRYNISKFGDTGEANSNINFVTVGAFLFSICLILNYFFHSIEYIREVTAQQKLEGLAYTDPLTGLANRAKCELTLADLKNEYTIISIDLDYLKYTNDNYGHAEGDRLLMVFAKILRDSFTDALLVGRMGGDEFLIILPYIDDERTKRDLRCFEDLMNFKNSSDSVIRYSASYGYAASNDKKISHNPTAQNVYLLADARMYNMKNQHHNQSLGRLYDDLVKDMGKEQEGGTKDE